jgi:hypothetical protein
MPRILTTHEYEIQRAALSDDETVTDDMAKTIASWWHGGHDHNITALSHGREWNTEGISDEIDCLLSGDQTSGDDLAQLKALRDWANDQMIVSVWSSDGHRFTDSDGYESCLTCGAEYMISHDDPDDYHHGRYHTNNGDDPTACTGDTSMVHGGGYCESCHGDDESCPHCHHDCNCVLCTG